jgi:uncharacterized protein (TIGR03067 family)
MTLLAISPLAFRLARAAERSGGDLTPRDSLQGNWTAISAERAGQKADDIPGHRLTIAGNTFLIASARGELLYHGTWTADASANPARIDFHHEMGALQGRMWKGIYIRNGNSLLICDNAPDLTRDRPTRFTTTLESGSVSIRFEQSRW